MSTMSTLKALERRLWDKYPKEPMVYVCSHNGVTGVVRAEDFDDEIRRMRKYLNGHYGHPRSPVRPQVYPVFLFSDKPRSNRDFRVGTMEDFWRLLMGCYVEQRTFELPPLSAPGMMPDGYSGIMWEEVGREGSRHRHWTFEEAYSHTHAPHS